MSTPQNTPDPLFVAFAREGSASAFGSLVEKHLGAVLATARRVLGGRRELAEDVAQLVFLRLARKGESLPEGIVVGAWLHRQTVRLALNAVRGESRRQVREQHAAEIQSIETMEEQASWEELVPHLDRAILDLPNADREALALRFHEQAKLREIGERLGLSTAAAEKRVSRALEKLRTVLTRRGVTLSATGLSLVLSERAVEAAPPALAASIAGQAAIEIPIATSTLFSNTIITMTFVKSIVAGLALGLLVGGVVVARPGKDQRRSDDPRNVLDPERLTAILDQPGNQNQITPRELSTDAIFAQVQALLAQPDNEIIRLRLRALFDQLTADQCAPFLALIESEIPSGDRRRVMGHLSLIWGELDPPAALSGLISERSDAYAVGAFRVWIGNDSAAAQRWLVENQGKSEFEKAVPSMITIVATDLVADSEHSVVEWAGQLAGDNYREAALAALWKRYTKDSSGDHTADLERLFSTFVRVEDSGLQRLSVRSLGREWARARATEFEGWLDQQAPGQHAYEAAAGAVELHMLDRFEDGRRVGVLPDLLAATKRALRLSGERPQAETLAELIQSMALMREGVAEFALPILEGPSREAAILHASQLAINATGWSGHQLPPETALEWAVHLNDPVIREAVIYGQCRKWLQTKRWNSTRKPDELIANSEWADEIGPILQRAKEDL